MLEDPPLQPVDASRKRASDKSGPHRLGRPIEKPTFIAPQAEEAKPTENPARAGTHRVERVTATYFNLILLIIKLRNILKKRAENRRAAASSPDALRDAARDLPLEHDPTERKGPASA